MNRHVRSSSANVDNRAFQQAIARMRMDMLEAKAETQRVQDQLNCLVMLVKRAWMGDQAAAIHVANIVGVAPPKFQQESDGTGLTAEYKTSAIHHWAMLSIGLLNRHYKQLEQQALAKAKSRLQRRQDYLDEQLSAHRSMLRRAAGNKLATLKKTNPYLEQESGQVRHLKARTRPKSSPVFRSTYGAASLSDGRTREEDSHARMAADNLIEYMANTTLNDSQIRNTHLNRRGSGSKYNQPGLFDSSHVMSDKPRKPRPTSAHLHKSDARRARPKSAVVVKGERPLKYETTRPLSAKSAFLTQPQDQTKSRPPRPKSSKVISSNLHSVPAYEDPMTLLDDSGSSEGERSNGEGYLQEQDSVQAFTHDMKKMQNMENNFKRTTKLLQQRLGIPGEGAV